MSKKPKTDEEGYALVLTKTTKSQIANHLGVKRQSLTRWKRVPPHHIAEVARLTGLPREYISPSLFA